MNSSDGTDVTTSNATDVDALASLGKQVGPRSARPAISPLPGDLMAELVGEDLPTEVYLRVLGHRTVTRETLLETGYSPEAVDAAVAILESRRLITATGPGNWSITPPNQSFPALAAQLEARANTIRASLPGIVAAYQNSRNGHMLNAEEAGIEHLATQQDVTNAVAQCLTQTRKLAHTMRRGNFTTRVDLVDVMPGVGRGEVSLTGRRIEIRTVLDEQLARGLTAAQADQLLSVPTESIRLAGGVPFSAVVNDDGQAVLEVEHEGQVSGLLLTNPGLVQAVARTIDLTWRIGAPWRRTESGDAVLDGPIGITDEQRQILTMMAAGLPDATIARHLGIAPRTLDRRIRRIMDLLNATTRFQAGGQARLRGWI